MKGKIRNSANFQLIEADRETVGGVSVTVPDESLTVRDIVDRFTKGHSLGVGQVKEPIYNPDADFDSEDLEKVKSMDLFDLQQYREAVADRAYAIEAELKKREASDAAKAAAHDERVKRALDLLDSEESDMRFQDKDATGRRKEGGRAKTKGRVTVQPDADQS